MRIGTIRLDRMRLPLAAGFRAAKIRISRTDPGTSLEALRATRAAVGDGFALMADLNQWWRMAGDTSPALDLAYVRRIAAELADLGVFWLEEPLPGGDLSATPAEPHRVPRAPWRTPGSAG